MQCRGLNPRLCALGKEPTFTSIPSPCEVFTYWFNLHNEVPVLGMVFFWVHLCMSLVFPDLQNQDRANHSLVCTSALTLTGWSEKGGSVAEAPGSLDRTVKRLHQAGGVSDQMVHWPRRSQAALGPHVGPGEVAWLHLRKPRQGGREYGRRTERSPEDLRPSS